jgi:sugar (pentulose or hexulose) kinase
MSNPAQEKWHHFPLALALDFGTSGVRGVVVDGHKQVVWECRQAYPDPVDGLAQSWRSALYELLEQLPIQIAPGIGAIAINGTSATVILCDAQGHPLTEPLIYNDGRGRVVLDQVRSLAPAESPVVSATSSLTKLLWWSHTLPGELWEKAAYLLSQADWLSAQLHGKWGVSDYHNSLKLGYDIGALHYPDWLRQQPWSGLLPRIVAPGTVIGPIREECSQRFNLSPNCQVVAGTTDSIAAFLASGAKDIGDAVTSLGSTLVIKLLSQHRVDASQYGIYSHRLDNLWLVGGASNTGGAVLQQFFDSLTLERLSQKIDPDSASADDLDYYPLLAPGERFPINDPSLLPRLTPRPEDDVAFLQGLLLGIARIEKQGYDLLEKLGASPTQQILTAGGGAQNDTWRRLRANLLQKPIKIAAHPEAATGSAYLALGSLKGD